MNRTPHFHRMLLLSVFLSSCEQSPSGLEQRLIELETRLAAKEAETVDLRAKLDEARNAKPPAPPPAVDVQANTRAGVFAAATVLAESLKDQIKPRALSVSGEVAYAGFTAKAADGSERGVAVPFFRDGEGSSWRSGWPKAQILSALEANPNPPAIAPSPTDQTTSAPSIPAPSERQAPESKPAPPPEKTIPGLPPGWTYDSGANVVIAPTGARIPPAPPGWKYGVVPGAEGETPRAFILSPEGVRKYYINE